MVPFKKKVLKYGTPKPSYYKDYSCIKFMFVFFGFRGLGT